MYDELIARQREFFLSGATLPISFRLRHLEKLRQVVAGSAPAIENALTADLRRNGYETFLAEIAMVLASLRTVIKKNPRWTAARNVWPSLFTFPARSQFAPEPLGVCLVISPWNYPFLLTLGPLIAAISAGNCAVLKPSSASPATSALLGELVAAAFPPEYVTLIQGDAEGAYSLISKPFDKIFFTGSRAVGEVVAQAAAMRLTPVTLELGGKSPCIVTASADLNVAARRIIWGKMLNAGQTCVAPDYLLAHHSVRDALIERLIQTAQSFYGPDIQKSPYFPRIVNRRHLERLRGYLDPAKIAWGGEYDLEDLYLAPTIMRDVTWDDPVMREEIFGPILPVLSYDNLEDVAAQLQTKDRPLALYLFTRHKREADLIWTRCRFGGGCVNDTLLHLGNEHLPFGGVGESGMGAYHGQWGFEAFSHRKSRLTQYVKADPPFRYPPYAGKEFVRKCLSWLLG